MGGMILTLGKSKTITPTTKTTIPTTGYGAVIPNILSGKFITQGFTNPVASVIPVSSISGVAATVTKNITTNVTKGGTTSLIKLGGAALGGFVLANLFGGTKQTTTQTPTQAPTQTGGSPVSTVSTTITTETNTSNLTKSYIYSPTTTKYDINYILEAIGQGSSIFGGSIAPSLTSSQAPLMPTTQTVTPITETGTNIPYNQTQTPTQTTTAQQTTENWGLIALIVAGVAALYFLGKKKK